MCVNSNNYTHPANTRRSPDAGLMLAHRLQRWPNIGEVSSQNLVFAWQILHI